ncbi:hypothetical protein NX059_008661 [Plenodomus lindquistii]|nr:hypothetical protein NX059_008661 [Plenodomus lindquistii]
MSKAVHGFSSTRVIIVFRHCPIPGRLIAQLSLALRLHLTPLFFSSSFQFHLTLTLTMAQSGIATTYDYRTLEGDEIRLLQVSWEINPLNNTGVPTYRLVHKSLPPKPDEPPLEYEAVSYQWGEPLRISGLSIEHFTNNGTAQTIGLTQNLTDALPCLLKQSKTNLLWIDQLCINQGEDEAALSERSRQVSRMSEIYTRAKNVIVWTGPADGDSDNCKEYLDGLAEYLHGLEDREKITPGTATYDSGIRYFIVRSTFSPTAPTDAKFAPSIRQFFTRPWFTRGWIVQEFLLASSIVVLAGDTTFSSQDLFDMQTVPITPGGVTNPAYNMLLNMRLRPFKERQPLKFLRTMHEVAGKFETRFLQDSLNAFLGLLEDTEEPFRPDFNASIRTNFTRFAATLAEKYGSLDFLSMWSANLDDFLPQTPGELRKFPSWVPAWTDVPLQSPFRLAMGGVRTMGYDVAWDACGGRKHKHQDPNEVAYKGKVPATDRLVVKGMVVDVIDRIASDVVFNRYWDFTPETVEADNAYLDDLVDGIKTALDLQKINHWTREDMLRFLREVEANGADYTEDSSTSASKASNDMVGFDQNLALTLSVGRGRRFMRTKGSIPNEEGSVGLAPMFGSKVGSLIVILHGCSVPIVLELANEEYEEYKVVGDCYVEGIMMGEAVKGWEEDMAQTFILI